MIRLTEAQWAPLHQRLAQDYHDRPSVMLIRSAMRQTLGFTVRRHREWREGDQGGRYCRDWICLDFYDAALETWFRLKYSEFLP